MRLPTAISFSLLAAILLAGFLFASRQVTRVMAGSIVAAPPQAPTVQPTRAPSAPTKPPYVFPTPIFIPTSSVQNPAPSPTRKPGATTAPASSGAVSTGERTYTVQAGDTAWTIAQKVYGDGNKYLLLLSANGMVPSSTLHVGQVLKVPGQSTSVEPTLAELTSPGIAIPSSPTKAPPTAARAIPGGARTPVPTTSGVITGTRYELALMALNLLSGILLTGSGVFGVLSYSMFQRARRLEKITMMTRRIRPSYYY